MRDDPAAETTRRERPGFDRGGEAVTNRVRKAVFPVAGLGTRFLPATKALAKEMIPVIDKPLIQYAVEEAVAAGIDHLVFVTGHTKKAIEDHFDRSAELEATLEAKGKTELLARVRAVLPSRVTCMYIRQPAPLGLGHAVLCARPAIGRRAVRDPASRRPHRLRRPRLHRADGAVVSNPPATVSWRCSRCRERRPVDTVSCAWRRRTGPEAPSAASWRSRSRTAHHPRWRWWGRYVMPAKIFDALENTSGGRGRRDTASPTRSRRCSGARRSALSHSREPDTTAARREGFVAANVSLALKDPELRPVLRRIVLK